MTELSEEELEHRVNLGYLLGAEEEHLSRRYDVKEAEIEDYLEYDERELSLPGEISLDIVDEIYTNWNNLNKALDQVYSENDGLALPKFDIKQTLKKAELRGSEFKDYETVDNDLPQWERVPTSPPWAWHVGAERELPGQGTDLVRDVIRTRDYPLGIGEEKAVKWYKESIESDPSEKQLREFREEVIEPSPNRGFIESARAKIFPEITEEESEALQETVDALTIAAQDLNHHAFESHAQARDRVKSD